SWGSPLGWAVGTAALAVLMAGAWLAAQAELKLSTLALGGLGESFSTRVWSAPFLVRDGGPAEPPRLLERLDPPRPPRAGRAPAKGEYRWSPPELAVRLRGFRTPSASQAEGLYSLRDDGGRWRLKDARGAAVPELRLEPELAAQLSGARRVRRDPLAWEQIPP